MPENTYIQYGSFGIIVFLVGWFVLYGFPRIMDGITASAGQFLTRMDVLERQYREERAELMRAFREELASMRDTFKQDAEADRQTRHNMGTQFQQALLQVMGPKKQPPGGTK